MAATTTWHGVDLRWAYADLLGGIQRRTGCIHRARDILHDSLVRFALVARRRPVEEPHAYLRTVVGSVLANQYRESARWVLLGDDELPAEAALSEQFAPSAEHLAEINQRLGLLQRIIDHLPPRCRQIFWLFRVEGNTQAEIAEQLGVSIKAVEYQLARALVDLLAVGERLR